MCDKYSGSRARKILQLLTNEETKNYEENIMATDEQPVYCQNTTPTLTARAAIVPEATIGAIDDDEENNMPTDEQPAYCQDTTTTLTARAAIVPEATIGAIDEEPQCSYQTTDEVTESHFSEDDDDSVKDPHYRSSSSCSSSSESSSSSSSSSSSCASSKTVPKTQDGTDTVETEVANHDSSTINADEENNDSTPEETETIIKRGKKRKARRDQWLTIKAKKLRNTGKAYISSSKSKKSMRAKELKPPCGEKCKLKCTEKINEEARMKIFTNFWDLGDVALQRNFINNCTKLVIPKVRFTGKEKPRNYNNAYYFSVGDLNIRVCKHFFMATLDVSDRAVRTVFYKRNDNGFLDSDKRGKHGRHRKLDELLKQSVRDHINSIPRIESHYIRKNSSREYIDGGKCLADLHTDYKSMREAERKEAANYRMYTKIFNEEFNISFFIPKKDQCELCVSYVNADEAGKEKLSEKYFKHKDEKKLSRDEKENDKKKASSDYIVAVYDLQAVLQCPNGEVSVFYYKSKLNTLNLTVSELGLDHTECYLWHEGEAARGADEIGSCVLSFIDKIMSGYIGTGVDFVFYSDNCCGQQKNQFVFAMYIFALKKHAKIKSITHKYLITGHTQNEGDSVHSTIEKAIKKNLKSGPIYVPCQYAQIIRTAKKNGKPYIVNERSYIDFYSLKSLSADIGFNSKALKISEIKVFKVVQGEPTKAYVKYSYSDKDFLIKTIRRSDTQNLSLKKAYRSKPKIKDNKKKDLMSLIEKYHIPNFYASFYETL